MRSYKSLINSYKQNWELAVTEWNLCPTFDFKSSVTAERDMTAAVYQASCIKTFLEEEVNAAMVFQLRSEADQHFGLVEDSDGNIVRP